jgi:predicted hydrocarbon binding protein
MTDGLFLPNRFVRTTINALQEVVGVGAMKTIYRQAELPDLGENPLPDTMDCEFSFTDFARLFHSLSEVMGQRGGRSLSIRAGRICMRLSGLTFGTSPLSSTMPPVASTPDSDMLLVRLNRLSNFLNSVSDMRTLVCKREGQPGYEFLIRQCPICKDRTAEGSICGFFEGLLDEAVKEFSYKETYQVEETECMAAGSPACKFIITEPEADTEPDLRREP